MNKINFPDLWTKTINALGEIGELKMKSVFLNSADNKEMVCRKHNIVSVADIQRIVNKIKAEM